jgi:hypothetical protein
MLPDDPVCEQVAVLLPVLVLGLAEALLDFLKLELV